MTLGAPSTLDSDYRQPALPVKHDSTLEMDSGSSPPGFRLVRLPFSRTATYDDVAFGDYISGIPGESSSTRTREDYLVEPIDPQTRLIDDREKQALEVYCAYAARIESLTDDAALDGFTVNPESEQDFWAFTWSVPFARRAELVLTDRGNLRAVWDREDGSHLGLQFLGGRMLQYVIFRRRKGNDQVSRVAGSDTFEGVKRQVRSFDLETFLGT